MKPEAEESPEALVVKIAMREEDVPEYDRVRLELIKVLEKLGGYEPAVDDIYIDQIVRNAIYSKRIEIFLDSDLATEYTYARVTDSKIKLAKIIENAMRQLAVTRRDRMSGATQASLMKELREAMLRGLKNAAK